MEIKVRKEIEETVPNLSTEAYERLKEDIRQRGITDPVVVDEEGNLIDGHHRYRISTELESVAMPEPIVRKGLEGDDMLLKQAEAIRINFNRRNLSAEQRTDLIRKQWYIAREMNLREISQDDIGRALGISQPRVHWLLNSESSKDVSIISADNANILDARRKITKDEEAAIVKSYHTEDKTQQELADDHEISRSRVAQILKKHAARGNDDEPFDPDNPDDFPDDYYRCIVIDPPWPMEKIEREERSNQGDRLDYRVMSLDDIAEMPIPKKARQSGCHIFLWTTQKYLPAAFEIFSKWEVRYECLLTWVKNVGITPFSWMYDTEHVLFGRIGSLSLEEKGLRLSFNAKVQGHSIKPDVFYDRVRRVSPEPRIDWFGRKKRDGFHVFGNKASHGCQNQV